MYSRALVGHQIVFGEDYAECRDVDERLKALEHPESNSLVVLDNDTIRAYATVTNQTTSLPKSGTTSKTTENS